jgi:hypothetical protein
MHVAVRISLPFCAVAVAGNRLTAVFYWALIYL